MMTHNKPALLLCLFSILSLGGAASPHRQDPQKKPTWTTAESPVTAPLEAAHFVSADRGWAVGWKGHVLATEDGGKTWKILRGPTKGGLRDVFFLDEHHGWAVGGLDGPHGNILPAEILETKDGGKTWVSRDDLVADAHEFSRVVFRGQTGWILGIEFSLITQDAGKTWTKLSVTGGDHPPVQKAFFFDSKFGALAHHATVVTSQDGGLNWSAKDLTSSVPEGTTLQSVFFASKQVGWVLGVTFTKTDGRVRDDTLVLKTEDGGVTWKTASTVTNGGEVVDVFFVDQSIGWIITHNHPEEEYNIMNTEDGGKTWKVQLRAAGDPNPDDSARKGEALPGRMFFTSASRGVAVGTKGLIVRFGEK